MHKLLFLIALLVLPILSSSSEIEIAYQKFGNSNEKLIFINGGPGRSSKNSLEIAKKLSELGIEVYIFDQRGTGNSKLREVSEKTISMDLMVNDLEDLRRRLKLKSVTILGHSFGGMYAMAYAAKYPKNIKSLILVSSGGIDLNWFDEMKTEISRKLNKDEKKQYDYWMSKKARRKEPVKARLKSIYFLAPAYVYKKEFIPEVRKRLIDKKDYNIKINDLVWKDLRTTKYDLKNKLSNFKKPVLILSGKEDFLGKKSYEDIKNSFPKSKLVLLDKCSHYPWWDSPNKFFSEISNFLNLK